MKAGLSKIDRVAVQLLLFVCVHHLLLKPSNSHQPVEMSTEKPTLKGLQVKLISSSSQYQTELIAREE